jgi:ABC-type transporter Mla subunit MlaD
MEPLEHIAQSTADRLANALEVARALATVTDMDEAQASKLGRLADELDATSAKLQGAAVKIRRHLRQRKKR